MQYGVKTKHINFNKVRLKFSAVDIYTGQEICEPVFSDTIYDSSKYFPKKMFCDIKLVINFFVSF